jgi:hypothetical protein
VRGLYGDGVWIKQENAGHYKCDINAMETSELNTILWAAMIGGLIVAIVYEGGGKTLLSGTAMVMTAPVLKGSSSLVVHSYTLETFDFLGLVTGRSK